MDMIWIFGFSKIKMRLGGEQYGIYFDLKLKAEN
jgi:hypothetical protein